MYVLNTSRVVFHPDTHTYVTPDGRKLEGVTGMLSRQLFPGKYDGIDEETLRNAAERGQFIHTVCELVDSLGVEHESAEAKGYKLLKDEYGLRHETSEYLVTDNEYFASQIDKVYREGDDTFSLADIKTTYRLDRDYVQWQLSVYAYLFEMQNPGASVAHLYGIWLRGEHHKLVEVERIPDKAIEELLRCEKQGEQFYNPCTPSEMGIKLPDKYAEMEDAIAEIEQQYKYWSDKRKELTEGVKKEMETAHVQKWEGERVSFTRTADTVYKDFDKARFAADHPELYGQYLVECRRKGSLRLNVK